MNDDDLIGKQLGEYRLDALLGQGGMARVYNATDVRLKRQAVIKLIDPPSRDDPGYMLRFEREAQIIGQLDHPNIVRLYRFDEQDGWLYMAMQHIEGADLGVVLGNYRAEKTFIQPEEARRIIREICAALDYAHQKGIVHRDVKPANILLDRNGRAFLSDFGLALITDVGTRGEIFGSPHYISPEQAVSSAKAVPQSDLYAMGIILYEMFTGELPFQAERPLDIAFLQITEAPAPPRQVRPEINPELEAVILRALAKKPEQRYQTGAELTDALDSALDARAAISLNTDRLAASASIVDRVALELNEPPLPLIPAAVAENAPAAFTADDADQSQNRLENPPISQQVDVPVAAPAGDNKTFTRVALGLGALILFSLGCLTILLIATSVFNNLSTSSQPLPATGMAPTDMAPVIVPTVEPANTTAPDQTATPQDVHYNLLIIKSKETLVVVNQSAQALPLALLRLGDGKSIIKGTEWSAATLETGNCVGVTSKKPKGKDKKTEEINCPLVGTLLLQEKPAWIAEQAFNVYYNGKHIGICAKSQDQCVFSDEAQSASKPTQSIAPNIASVSTCGPVTATITAPFTKDGAGTFCWQVASLGEFINSWNLTSLKVNGVDYTNVWAAATSLPAKIDGYYYIGYRSTVTWGHFETK